MQPTRMGKEGLDIVANESTEGGMTVRAQIGGIKVDDEPSVSQTNRGNVAENNNMKRYKCPHCEYSSNINGNIKSHACWCSS